jgi:hypothetical protein
MIIGRAQIGSAHEEQLFDIKAGTHVIEMKAGTGKTVTLAALAAMNIQLGKRDELQRLYEALYPKPDSANLPRLLSRLGLIAGLLVKPDAGGDFIDLLEAKYERRYLNRGKVWATAYCLSDIARSLSPVAGWVFRRLLVAETVQALWKFIARS